MKEYFYNEHGTCTVCSHIVIGHEALIFKECKE